jgi:hypothetical protein
MKLHHYSNHLHTHIILAVFTVLFLSGCKKEDIPISRVTASQKSDVVSDGTVSVQASILPPATQQSFIPNGSTSTAVFEIVSSQHVVIESGSFGATYPLIEYLVPDVSLPFSNNGGTCAGYFLADVPGGGGIAIPTVQHYLAVDSSTSGTVVHLNFQSFFYQTDDERYHELVMGNKIKAQDMCLVNNVPHLKFQNPPFDTLQNGYTEIAQVKLIGDTGWVLNKLPLNFASYTTQIFKCKLIIKYKGKTLDIKSDSVQVDYEGTVQTTVQFVGGFKHKIGNAEILKIYALINKSGMPHRLLRTRLFPLGTFEWIDDLGTVLPGTKNVKFFKEPTGQSEFYH